MKFSIIITIITLACVVLLSLSWFRIYNKQWYNSIIPTTNDDVVAEPDLLKPSTTILEPLAHYEQSHYHVPAEEKWEPYIQGVEQLFLNRAPGRVTVLYRWAPHTITTGKSEHTYYEESLVLEGRLLDASLGTWVEKGAYTFRHPGMLHGPYSTGEEGALVLVITIEPAATAAAAMNV